MSETESGQPDDSLGAVELDDDEYTVKQKLFRNRYRVYDTDGTLVLKAKQKMFKMREDFPFTDADGNTVFRVKAESILDHAGDYTLTDEASGDPVLVLDKNFTLFQHSWTVRRPDGKVLAEVSARGALIEFLRYQIPLLGFLPHHYTIETPDGEQIGEIAGQFSLRDQYEVRVDSDVGDMPREGLVAAAIAIDALEGN